MVLLLVLTPKNHQLIALAVVIINYIVFNAKVMLIKSVVIVIF